MRDREEMAMEANLDEQWEAYHDTSLLDGDGIPNPRGLTAEDTEHFVDECHYQMVLARGQERSKGSDYVQGKLAALKWAQKFVIELERNRWLKDGMPRAQVF